MSRVYFHSELRDVELAGAERAWLAALARGVATTAWDLHGTFAYERAAAIMAMTAEPPAYVSQAFAKAQAAEAANERIWAARGSRIGGMPAGLDYEPQRQFVSSLSLVLRVDGVDLAVAGERLRSQDVALNTALVAGSPPVQLAAKIDGWCERHCWVEGPDRDWLADLIDEGLAAGLYRRTLRSRDADGTYSQPNDLGWGEVTTMLREEHDRGPVVLSYSVTSRFPSPELVGWPTDADGEYDDSGWYELDHNQQWEHGMLYLRNQRPWAQLTPDTLAGVMFGLPVSIYDLFAEDREERVQAAARAGDEVTPAP